MKKLCLLALSALIALCGCDWRVAEDAGALQIEILASGLRTLSPSLDMTVAHYDIAGSGPGGRTFDEQGITGTTYTRNGLPVGAWTITVTAKNAGDTAIATGQTTVTVEKGATASGSVTVTPMTGTGTLSLTVNWPPGTIASPSATGRITTVGGSSTDVTLTAGTDSASYSGPWEAGYYTLALQLNDGGVFVWGTVEAVRILSGQTTSGTFTVNPNTGALSLTITPNLRNPVSITLSGNQGTLALGSNMTVNTTLNPAVTPDGYSWYLDGTVLPGQTSSSLTIGSALSVGTYTLAVVVKYGNTLASGGFEFQVVEQPSLLTTISFGSSRAGVICANPSTNRIYASKEDAPGIAVIDGATNTEITTVPALGYHTGIDVNPATNRIYVSQEFACSVRVIDGATNGVVTDIYVPHLGNSIGQLAVNPTTNYVYVVRLNNIDIAVLNGATNSYLTNITGSIDASAYIAVNPVTNRVYVSNATSKNVMVIDGSSNAVLTTIPLGVSPYDIAVNTATNRIYVNTSPTVTVIDGATNAVVDSIPVNPNWGIKVNSARNRIYVSDGASSMSFINGATKAVEFTLPVASLTSSFAVVPGTDRVYVSCSDHTVKVLQD